MMKKFLFGDDEKIYINRALAEDPMWLKDRFTKGQAWIDLTLLATPKDVVITFKGKEIPIKKGQVGWSISKLAERWQWSRGKVKRFFDELVLENMIVIEDASKVINVNGTQNGTQYYNVTSLISIVNWDVVQSTERKMEC